jgi:hypothetical protein
LLSTIFLALAVQRYIGQWNPYLDCDIAPVLDDAELTAIGRQIIADNNANPSG